MSSEHIFTIIDEEDSSSSSSADSSEFSPGPLSIQSSKKTNISKKNENPITTEDWASEFERVIRRLEIERLLTEELPLSEIKASVRKHESEIDLRGLTEALISEEQVIDPRMAKMASELSDELRAEYPQITALVLLGSSVHGGALVRHATRHPNSPDLDWGIIYRSETDVKLRDIDSYVDRWLELNAQKYTHKDMHSCYAYNGSTQYAFDMTESEDAGYLESKIIKLSGDFLAMYLQPSFPPEVNQKNRQILISVLDNMRIQHPDIFNNVFSNLLWSWSQFHRLKHKHFRRSRSMRTQSLVDEVIKNSPEAMNKEFISELR